MDDLVTRQLREHGHFVTVPKGYSMYPMLENRECAVEILPLSAPLRKNDVALYRAGDGNYVLHRVKKLSGDTVIFQGDHNPWTEKVPADQVVGVAVRYLRGGEWITMDDPRYRWYVRLLPLRRSWILLRRLPGKIKRKIVKK